MSVEMPGAATRQEKRRQTRVSAENRYPVYDLADSVLAAKAVKERGGNACSPEQLGAFLNYKNTRGGGFVARVAAAKAFGLIQTVHGRYAITAEGETVLFPVREEARQKALRDAFLRVPLYRQVFERHKGVKLPEEFGMRNFLQTQFGIPPGDRVARAYKILMDSAEQAGFFVANQGSRTHLVDPVIGGMAFTPPPVVDPQPNEDLPKNSGGRGGGPGDDVRVHPALRGLLTLIPPEPAPWAGRAAFDRAWEGAMEMLYPRTKTEGGDAS